MILNCLLNWQSLPKKSSLSSQEIRPLGWSVLVSEITSFSSLSRGRLRSSFPVGCTIDFASDACGLQFCWHVVSNYFYMQAYNSFLARNPLCSLPKCLNLGHARINVSCNHKLSSQMGLSVSLYQCLNFTTI